MMDELLAQLEGDFSGHGGEVLEQRAAGCPLAFDEHTASLATLVGRVRNAAAPEAALSPNLRAGLTAAAVRRLRAEFGENTQPLALPPPACFSAKHDPFPPVDAPWWQDLQRKLEPRSTALRAGATARVAASELVVGDVVVFSKGDRITADLRVLAATSDAALDVTAFYPEHAGMPRVLTLDASGGGIADCMLASNIALSGTTVASGAGVGLVVKTGDRTVVSLVGRATLDEPVAFAAPGYTLAMAKAVFEELCTRAVAVRNPSAMAELSSAGSTRTRAEAGETPTRWIVWAASASLRGSIAELGAREQAGAADDVVWVRTSADDESAAVLRRAAEEYGAVEAVVGSIDELAALVAAARCGARGARARSRRVIYVGGGGGEHLDALAAADVGVATVEASQVESDAADVCVCVESCALTVLLDAADAASRVAEEQRGPSKCTLQ